MSHSDTMVPHSARLALKCNTMNVNRNTPASSRRASVAGFNPDMYGTVTQVKADRALANVLTEVFAPWGRLRRAKERAQRSCSRACW